MIVGAGALYYLNLTAGSRSVTMMARRMELPPPVPAETTPQAGVSERVESAPTPKFSEKKAVIQKVVEKKAKQARLTLPQRATPRSTERQTAVSADGGALPGPAPGQAMERHSEQPTRAGSDSPVSEQNVPRDMAARDVYLFAAKSCEARKDYMQALKNYTRAHEHDPSDYRVLNNLAGVCIQLRMFGQALAMAQRALVLKDDYVPALVNAGIATKRQGNDAKAIEYFNKALSTEPTNRYAAFNLALLNEQANRLEEAAAAYRLMADGGDPLGFAGLARICEKQAKVEEAITLYRRILAMAGADPKTKDHARERLAQLTQ